ncbi:hypothetical protein [Flavobacterium sp. T12S277]|uniref:hypothetical protein n=1 Tax=Flavobacterium sp. T12S277 TaxID=3402752 RepID=UPI003AE6D7E8
MFEVSTWKNSNNINVNAYYAIRIKKRDYFALENWQTIRVGENHIERNNRPFTEQCPEIRSIIIRDFLFENNLQHWPLRQPHTLFLFEYEENQFELLLENPQ